MKDQLLKLSIFIASLFVFSCSTNAQLLDKITRRCPSPNGSVYASILVQGSGDVRHTPCPSRASIFTGNVDFSGATVTGLPGGGGINGSGTVNFIPRFTAATTLGNSGLSFNGVLYDFDNAVLGSEWRMKFNSSIAGASGFQVGDFTTTPTTFAQISPGGFGGFIKLQWVGANSFIDLNTLGDGSATFQNAAGNGLKFTAGTQAELYTQGYVIGGGSGRGQILGINTVGQGTVDIGDANGNGNGTTFNVNDNTATFSFSTISPTGTFNVQNITTFQTFRTITAAGTTGNQTINRPFGTVNFAAGTSVIVVTNTTANATSLIFCNVQANDATAIACRVTDKGAGAFTIRLPANATAETPVAFMVTN